MAITEIGLVGVKPDHQVMDSSTPSGKALDAMYESIIKAPGGPSTIYYGVETGNPLKLWALFDWESIEEHVGFAKSTGYKLTTPYSEFATHSFFSKHITLSQTSQPSQPSSLPQANPAFKTPSTSITLLYISPSATSNQRSAAEQKVKLFIKQKEGQGKKATWGWGLDDDWPVLDGYGEKEKEGKGKEKEKEVGGLLGIFVGEDEKEKDEGDEESGFEGVEGVLKVLSFEIRFKVLERD